jgi:preflagellin peptidase FlaK
MLDVIALLASFLFLGYSSWQDILTREVPDQVWLVSYPVAIVLIAARFIVQSSLWWLILLSVGSGVIIALGLSQLGLWGGADAKVFICLAMMNPLVPALGGNLSHIIDPLFPLVIFSNSYLASLASVAYAIARNLQTRPFHALFAGLESESLPRKIAAFVSGYRVSFDELESKSYLFLLESIDKQGSTLRRRFRFDPTVDSDHQRELEEMKTAADSGLLHGTVWASPGLPFLLFVTLGLVLSLVLGDIVWYAVSALIHSVMTIL